MPAPDPALIARAEAQLRADPRYQALRQRLGQSRAGNGAFDPRQFGIDYLPPGYVISGTSGRVVNQHDYADVVIPAIAAAGMGLGASGIIPGFGGLAGGASQSPQLGNVNSTIDALSAGHAADAASAAAGLGNVNHVTDAASIAGTTKAGTSAIDAIRKSLTSPEGIAGLGGLVAALATRNSGGGGNSGSTDELRRIQAITEARMRRADPLHEVATQLAYQRAPIAAKSGIQLPRVPLP